MLLAAPRCCSLVAGTRGSTHVTRCWESMLAAFAFAIVIALLAPAARAAAGCFFDNATSPWGPPAHSYIGGNIFGDKHMTNTSSSPEACCAL